GVGSRTLPGLYRRLDEPAHRLRMLLREGGRREYHVRIEIDPMVAQHHDIDVLALDAEPQQRRYGGHDPGGCEIDLPANEHGLADLRLHVRPLHAARIDSVHAREHIEQTVGCVDRRCAALAPHEVGRLFNPRLLERDQAEWCLVVYQENGEQLLAWIPGIELDQGAEIAEPDVMGAAGHLGDR